MMGVVGLTLRALVLAQHRLGTSSQLHSKLCEVTLGAPIAFFDVTPTGTYLLIIEFKLLTIGLNKLEIIRVELMTE